MKKTIQVISHRGAVRKFPENSLAAVKFSWANDCTPEIDISLTHDKVLILMHDDSIKHSCNGPDLFIKENTYNKLLGFRLCSGDGIIHKITLLEDVLKQLTVDSNRKIVLDIKDQEALSRLKTLIQTYRVERQVSILCREEKDCETVKKTLPECKVLWSFKDLPKKISRFIDCFFYCAEKGRIDHVLKNPQKYLPPTIKLCKDQKIQFGVVILEKIPAKILQQLMGLEIDMIGIENIDRYKATLKEL